MIAETLIASVAAITIVGTWLGLRFAEKTLTPEEARDKKREAAMETVRRGITYDTGENRDRVKALLVTEPESLPDDVRARVCAWLDGETVEVPKRLDGKEPPR